MKKQDVQRQYFVLSTGASLPAPEKYFFGGFGIFAGKPTVFPFSLL